VRRLSIYGQFVFPRRAGVRVVDVTPLLLDELKLHRASSEHDGPQDLVFGTGRGTMRNRSNILGRSFSQRSTGRTSCSLATGARQSKA